MALIVPTITAASINDFNHQFERLKSFAPKLHIDIGHRPFLKRDLLAIGQTPWPKKIPFDVHLMVERPLADVTLLTHIRPTTVIVHAEAEIEISRLSKLLHTAQIKLSVALLPDTSIEKISPMLALIDQVLIFSGNLGHQGGSVADLSLLHKADRLRALKPNLELAWDGGINEDNAHLLAASGIDFLNCGSFIQLAKQPQSAYAKLTEGIKGY